MAKANILIKKWTGLYTTSISCATSCDATEHNTSSCKARKKQKKWQFWGRGEKDTYGLLSLSLKGTKHHMRANFAMTMSTFYLLSSHFF